MRKNYDFKNGVRGKYADRFKEGTVIVLLEPDIAKAFPNARSVNETLRQVLPDRKPLPGKRSKNTDEPDAGLKTGVRSRPAKKKIAKRRVAGA